MRIISFTENGCVINKRLCEMMNAHGFSTGCYEGLEKKTLKNFTAEGFEKKESMIFIGAAGIAVRSIAAFLEDKFTDPTVIVIDEGGRFVIPILSGHVGGGNEIATEISRRLGAQVVITTATDINGVFAVDTFAKNNGLIIKERELAKKISVYLLKGKKVGFICDGDVQGRLPQNLCNTSEEKLGICISATEKNPFDETLHLVPKALYVGIGCRRGISKAAIKAAVESVFKEQGLDKSAIDAFAGIDIKKDEQGLLDFCHDRGKKILFFSADEMKNATGEFTASAFVEKVTGVDNVCERSAVTAAENGVLVVRKHSLNGVTVAVGEKKWGVDFE